MQNAKNWKDLSEVDLFNRIATFSVAGLSLSMAMVTLGGLQIQSPWF